MISIYSFIQQLLCMSAKLLQSCPTLWDPEDCSLQAFSVHGILQTRILEWVAMPSSRGSSQSRNLTHISCSSCNAGELFTTRPPGEAQQLLTMSLKCSRYCKIRQVNSCEHRKGHSPGGRKTHCVVAGVLETKKETWVKLGLSSILM